MKYAKGLIELAARKCALSLVYAAFFTLSIFLAFEIRDDFSLSIATWSIVSGSLGWILTLKLTSLYLFRQYRELLTYFRLPDLYRLAAATGFPTALLLGLSLVAAIPALESKSVLLLDFFFSLSLLCLFRTGLRIYREKCAGRFKATEAVEVKPREDVVVFGAGSTGSALVSHLLSKRHRQLRPVAFVDDDPEKWGKHIHGLRVYPTLESLCTERNCRTISRGVVAMPGASPSKVREIADAAAKHKIPIEIVPSWEELVSGKKRVDRLRPVRIEDLLGRTAISLHSRTVLDSVEGKVVMVTGAGGTIGSELCRQIAECKPSLLIMVERAEYLLFQTEQKIKAEFPNVASHAFIADVTDKSRMDFLLGGFLPNIVYHAAAHKHVPMMEHQPGEALHNNTLGTVFLADLAIKHEVERFVLISSDKAVNPTNVMGVSKRLAEIFLQSLQGSALVTQFVAVRFGNVLGSSGSVIPTFRRQIEEGGPITVTHPEITRYFMTVSEAVQLVLECSIDAEGGEIFVLDMGEPIKICDLAKQMVKLSGLQLGEDIDLVYTGLRPGEKLYEELQHTLETLQTTCNDKVFRFTGQRFEEGAVRQFLKELSLMLRSSDYNALKQRIQSFVPEYKPDLSAPSWAESHEQVAHFYGRQTSKSGGGNRLASFVNQPVRHRRADHAASSN